jgi:histidinol-phosphate/aromatic aminotransferase/cobyric acid decarboxylase-like protein
MVTTMTIFFPSNLVGGTTVARRLLTPYAGAECSNHAAEQATEAAEAAQASRNALEAENRRLRAELMAMRGALKTAMRVLLPYYVPNE